MLQDTQLNEHQYALELFTVFTVQYTVPPGALLQVGKPRLSTRELSLLTSCNLVPCQSHARGPYPSEPNKAALGYGFRRGRRGKVYKSRLGSLKSHQCNQRRHPNEIRVGSQSPWGDGTDGSPQIKLNRRLSPDSAHASRLGVGRELGVAGHFRTGRAARRRRRRSTLEAVAWPPAATPRGLGGVNAVTYHRHAPEPASGPLASTSSPPTGSFFRRNARYRAVSAPRHSHVTRSYAQSTARRRRFWCSRRLLFARAFLLLFELFPPVVLPGVQPHRCSGL